MTAGGRDGPSAARLLAIYLRHHAAASQGGLDLFRRAARSHLDAEARRTLQALAGEVAADREALLRILEAVGVARPRVAEVVTGWAETVGRLKPNGTLLRRSPLSDVVELDALGSAVEAKRLGWCALRVLGESDDRFDKERLDELVRRAENQQDLLQELQRKAVVRALSGP